MLTGKGMGSECCCWFFYNSFCFCTATCKNLQIISFSCYLQQVDWFEETCVLCEIWHIQFWYKNGKNHYAKTVIFQTIILMSKHKTLIQNLAYRDLSTNKEYVMVLTMSRVHFLKMRNFQQGFLYWPKAPKESGLALHRAIHGRYLYGLYSSLFSNRVTMTTLTIRCRFLWEKNFLHRKSNNSNASADRKAMALKI